MYASKVGFDFIVRSSVNEVGLLYRYNLSCQPCPIYENNLNEFIFSKIYWEFIVLHVASLRLGGEKVSYGHHVLIVGDAAGMIDPLTGK